jgi:phage terminase large subunit-like protein
MSIDRLVKKFRKLEQRAELLRSKSSTTQTKGLSKLALSLPVVELVPLISSSLVAPTWLSRYGDELDAAIERCNNREGEFVGVVIAAPPQHGKTWLTLHALVKLLLTVHDRSHAYVSFAQQTVDDMQDKCRLIMRGLGVEIVGTKTKWYVPSTNSTVYWTSICGQLTGRAINGLLVCDDPFKGTDDAYSVVERERRWNWLLSIATTRSHPGQTTLIMATRWHPDDLSGRAVARLGWPYVNIQAIDSKGNALAPSIHSLDFLQRVCKADAHLFSASYQGEPQELGAQLFGAPGRYVTISTHLASRTGYGIDLAYSTRSISDWSVMIRGRVVLGVLYIMHVERMQIDATRFLPVMVARQNEIRGPVRFYSGGGGELGVVSFLSRELRDLHALPASSDKVTRSTATRKAWNLRGVLVPESDSPYYGKWVETFVKEVCEFTGCGDLHDDQVDALAALFDELCGDVAIDWGASDDWQDQLQGFSV